MNGLELRAWKSFVDVVKNFLGENYNLVEKLLKSLQDIDANLNIKFHFFPDNCGDEQGERFHQDIKTMEECYQGQWDKQMMADYNWSIRR